ncbi:MAG TPA: DUF1697 domain-containing protein [Candidatus Saccharimonadales bacterium]|nr:DUF1697 domain-containing protein [Candidatus Saccharimonadales bacterium]
MRSHVALLRGINVLGRNRVALVDLRDLVISLRHTEVEMYIQSGNVVFSSPEADSQGLGAGLQQAIAERPHVNANVAVPSRKDLAQVVADNPYRGETDGKCVHAVFSSPQLAPDRVLASAAAQGRARERGSRDEARAVGRTLYLPTPGGFGRSELVAQLLRAATPRHRSRLDHRHS